MRRANTFIQYILFYDIFFFFRHACPVLNEVFAPYWVNNTRNQVRAILNLHPFEQYIHMEKCLYVFLTF